MFMQSSDRLALAYVIQKEAMAGLGRAAMRGVGQMAGRGAGMIGQGLSRIGPTGLKMGLGGAALGGGMYGLNRMMQQPRTGIIANARQSQQSQSNDLNEIQKGFR
jgi:hypothetical protein